MDEKFEETLAKFKHETQPYGGTWKSVHVKLVAGADSVGVWKVLALEATLSRQDEFGRDLAFDSPKLVMLKDGFNISALDDFSSALHSGRVVIAGKEFEVREFAGSRCDRLRCGVRSPLANSEFPYVMIECYRDAVSKLVDD